MRHNPLLGWIRFSIPLLLLFSAILVVESFVTPNSRGATTQLAQPSGKRNLYHSSDLSSPVVLFGVREVLRRRFFGRKKAPQPNVENETEPETPLDTSADVAALVKPVADQHEDLSDSMQNTKTSPDSSDTEVENVKDYTEKVVIATGSNYGAATAATKAIATLSAPSTATATELEKTTAIVIETIEAPKTNVSVFEEMDALPTTPRQEDLYPGMVTEAEMINTTSPQAPAIEILRNSTADREISEIEAINVIKDDIPADSNSPTPTELDGTKLQNPTRDPTAAVPDGGIVILSNQTAGAKDPIVSATSHIKNGSLYRVAPLEKGRKLTKLEIEFRDMILHFANYTERDIRSLRDPRSRALFEGVASSSGTPAVYRAFEVLFEDIYPVRLAGRLVFSNLKQLMEVSKQEAKAEIDEVVKKTGLDAGDVEEARLAFVSLASEVNGDAFLTVEQLKLTELRRVATEILGFDDIDDFMRRIVDTKKGTIKSSSLATCKLSFVDVMFGLQQCADEMCMLEACNPATIMHSIMVDLTEHPPSFVSELDSNRQRFSDRYDEMVEAFSGWEDLLPKEKKNGRIMDVVRGCFVGARNQKVVDALRILYVDYAPLRVGGDIIFRLVSGVMKGLERGRR